MNIIIGYTGYYFPNNNKLVLYSRLSF